MKRALVVTSMGEATFPLVTCWTSVALRGLNDTWCGGGDIITDSIELRLLSGVVALSTGESIAPGVGDTNGDSKLWPPRLVIDAGCGVSDSSLSSLPSVVEMSLKEVASGLAT